MIRVITNSPVIVSSTAHLFLALFCYLPFMFSFSYKIYNSRIQIIRDQGWYLGLVIGQCTEYIIIVHCTAIKGRGIYPQENNKMSSQQGHNWI